jgi:LysR family transcriptional regulator of gallate degradation
VTLEPFDLNLRHLRALDSIRTRGSMSAAAEAVSLSQPALTLGLAKLEKQIGTPLFQRRPDGMTATTEGTIFAERARQAFAFLTKAVRGNIRGFARPEHLMTATQLRAFLALADSDGFVGAARRTGLSQPAIHRAVRDLEQFCAVPLVERRGRGVSLTPAGLRLARGVRLAAAEIAGAITETRPDRDQGGGRITVGSMPLSRALILPRAIARFTSLSPRTKIDVVEGSWRELVDPLRDGVLDLMIGALREEPPLDLEQVPLMTDRLVVIGRADHPLARTAAPTLATLAAYPWIIGQTGTPLRAQWEALFTGSALPPAPIECGSVMVIREVLRHSDFLTLLSADQVRLEIATGILAPLGPLLEGSTRTIGVTTREGWRPTPAQRRFLGIISETALEVTVSEN